ncbi:MAG: divergent polysaccharide deacetylase family protein [Thermoanaerobaculaceae bacterium]|nr:divergent polysaccharide deacetylase family protein [Thermoanaerobaculaceae bacterium]
MLLAVSAVVYLAWRAGKPRPAPRAVAAAAVVREVAARFGCGPERVTEESTRDAAGPLALVTVHAPRRFQVERFVLDLEAAAHNLGGRVDPMPLLEKGGYGLARLEGEVAGTRWRVVVLREEPPAAPRPRAEAGRQAVRGARLAIVLDDAGSSIEVVREVERLPLTVAVAVLPNAARSAEVARGLGAQGRELLLHMPMEPVGDRGPGPGEGAVEVGLPPAEIRARVERALAVVSGARGVNNHMGSRATADAAAMRAVMDVLRPRGLYFLDSRTTADTVAEQTARASGVPALHRDVFLDVVSEPEAIRRALDSAAARARSLGSALAIGHVHPLTIEVLERELPRIGEEVRLVRPSQLVKPAG